MNNVTPITEKLEQPNILKEAYEYRLQKLKELKDTLEWAKVSPIKDANLSPEEQERIDKAYTIINEHRLQARLEKNTAKVAELEKDPVYQEAKEVMKKAKLTRDEIATLQGISREEAEALLYGKSPKKSVDMVVPAGVLEYRKGRESRIEGIDAKKKKNIIEVAEALIQSGQITYEQHPQGGWITHFQGIPGMQDTRFYDATRLVQEEIVNGEKMMKPHTYNVFGEQQQNNLVYLRAMRGPIPSTWASRQIGKLVEDQRSKYGLDLHSQADMEKCFAALGNSYQQTHAKEILDQQEQVALWMYLTGCYGRYRLSDYGKQNTNFRSYLACQSGSGDRCVRGDSVDYSLCNLLL